jgi:hypothetical protein
MQTYEIRLLNDDLTTRVIIEQQYISDAMAIRSAKSFAGSHMFEVWRGLTCVTGIIRKTPAISERPAA